MGERIFRREVSMLLGVDPKTVDKYAKKGILTPRPVEKRKNGVVISDYDKDQVLEIKKKMRRERKPGLSLIVRGDLKKKK